MTTMLNVITRLGLPGNSTLENRFLSVDIASTLFYWDHLAGQEVGHRKILTPDGLPAAGARVQCAPEPDHIDLNGHIAFCRHLSQQPDQLLGPGREVVLAPPHDAHHVPRLRQV